VEISVVIVAVHTRGGGGVEVKAMDYRPDGGRQGFPDALEVLPQNFEAAAKDMTGGDYVVGPAVKK
jgi:hypothetical protein